MDPEAYQALHRELVAACRALGGPAEGTKREFYQRLEELARPWLTARVLEQADREILLDLLARCRQAEQELQPPPRPRAVLRWALAAVALFLAVAVVIRLVWTPDRIWSPAQEWVRGRWAALMLPAQVTGDAWWFIPGALAILVGMVVVWRSGRRFTGQ
jgi:hypothetical protein